MLVNFIKLRTPRNSNIGDCPESIPVGKDILMVFNMVLFILSRYIMVVYTIYLQQWAFWAIKDPLAAFFLC